MGLFTCLSTGFDQSDDEFQKKCVYIFLVLVLVCLDFSFKFAWSCCWLTFVLFCWPFSLIYLCFVFNWTFSLLHSIGVKHGLYAYTECILFLFNLATSYIVSLCNRLYFGSEVVNCEFKKIKIKKRNICEAMHSWSISRGRFCYYTVYIQWPSFHRGLHYRVYSKNTF